MLKHSKYFKALDGCAILCFDFAYYCEVLRLLHEAGDRKGIQGSFAMQNRLFELIAGWKKRLGPDMGTALASRIGGDGAFVIFKGKNVSINVQRALRCAKELKERHLAIHYPGDPDFSEEDAQRLRHYLFHMAIHVGRVYQHDSELIPMPEDEPRYNYVSHDMHICARIMRFAMKGKYDAILSEQVWQHTEKLLFENIQPIRSNRKSMTIAPDAKMFLHGLNFDTVNWEKVAK